MKLLALLCLSMAAASVAHARNVPFTLDFNQIFAKQTKSSDQFDFNLYEEGCGAADFIVPQGSRLRVKANEGVTCKVANTRTLADGSKQLRVLIKIETDSQESCSVFVISPELKKRAIVNLSCIGT